MEECVSSHKITEKRLQDSEERFCCFIESATEGFCLWDTDLNSIATNEAGIKLFLDKRTSEDIIGKIITELAPGIEKKERFKKYLHTIEFGKPLFLFDVDRGTLVCWPEGDVSPREIYSWNKKVIQKYRLPVPLEKLSYLAETVRNGEIFSFSDINELFSEAEKDYFLKEGTKSTIIIPMMIEGRVLGTLIYASFFNKKTWPGVLVQKLRLISQTFTYSLEKNMMKRFLKRTMRN